MTPVMPVAASSGVRRNRLIVSYLEAVPPVGLNLLFVGGRCDTIDRKLCICLYERGVGVKLPEHLAAALLQTDPNADPFQPLGKPKMREWVQINRGWPEDYRDR